MATSLEAHALHSINSLSLENDKAAFSKALRVITLCFSAKPVVSEMGTDQQQTTRAVEKCSCVQKTTWSLCSANGASFTTGQRLTDMIGILVNRNAYDTSQPQQPENRNELVFVLATSHEYRKGSCGHDEEDHPKMKVFMYPKSGWYDRKQSDKHRRQQAVHCTDQRHADG